MHPGKATSSSDNWSASICTNCAHRGHFDEDQSLQCHACQYDSLHSSLYPPPSGLDLYGTESSLTTKTNASLQNIEKERTGNSRSLVDVALTKCAEQVPCLCFAPSTNLRHGRHESCSSSSAANYGKCSNVRNNNMDSKDPAPSPALLTRGAAAAPYSAVGSRPRAARSPLSSLMRAIIDAV